MMTLMMLVPPALVLAAATLGFARPGHLGRGALRAIEGLVIGALASALLAAGLLIASGPGTSPLMGASEIGLSVRLDAVSAVMLLLVGFVGWVVVRFAGTYLDGEAWQGRFMAWLCATLASVMLLVVAGNLVLLAAAWIGIGIGLRRLLLFYPDRPAAQRAARKQLVFARAGDVMLVAAALILAIAYGTTDIGTIIAAARAGGGGDAAHGAALLLAVAALFKSAQFPTHGWLTEVMEAPTPVSALLHAGVINAGGFLLIRFADVMLLSPAALAGLVMIGGFTALFAGMVMLTQPAVKTSLAWSTIAQMGFMIMQCGLALFPLALLHLVAHSLYKAHAFLSSGGAIERIATFRRPGIVDIPGPAAVARAFVVALLIYGLIGGAIGFLGQSPQALALGAILIFGIAYLLAQGLAEAAPAALTRRLAVLATVASLGYFALHVVANWLIEGSVPQPPAPGPLEWVLIALTVVSFGLVAVAQAMFPLWAYHPAAAGLRAHFSNGLYVNAMTDRLLGGWALRSTSSSNPRVSA
ncbi:NAD(P)H-quinone oxidoreductase subunit 5 [Polymorphobacter multimanifer]|uniref:Probable inorganic carbon transporter subunit DabB n=1 Tax=Polymorphobacter multimanifer TaxID=1070431 RepID=A0A841LGE4_9SPHN|nr:NADH-quinone oxidoreductase subunit L [Polymorphobacter multimanifer]MBB6228865.1 NAD(P)H-quinone oxidoreductase subunit 5 [Polymorphobacter multimanifer]